MKILELIKKRYYKMKSLKSYKEIWDGFKKGEIKYNEIVRVRAYGGVVVKIVKLSKPYSIDELGLPIKEKIVEEN
jgi:hypothetical protein